MSVFKHVAYFGQTPEQGTGSPINMLRHLRRLADDGWVISVVSEWGKENKMCAGEGWKILHLPHRRAWWPAYRPGNKYLRALRMKLLARECKKVFLGRKPDAILTYLSYHSEFMSEVAALYSLASKIPMTVIVADDALAFKNYEPAERKKIGARFRWILGQARKKWFVSVQLAEAYGFPPDTKAILMPIPEGGVSRLRWRPEFRERPTLVYAGFLYNNQFPLLRRLAKAIKEAGGNLLILSGDRHDVRELCIECSIEFQPLLPTNREAIDFVGRRAAGFLAAYCDHVEDMPWIKSSFPSKVVEFSHLGLPMLFVSPSASAVYKWSKDRKLSFSLQPEEVDGVAEFVTALRDPDKWKALAEPICHLAETEFNPELIQKSLAENLCL